MCGFSVWPFKLKYIQQKFHRKLLLSVKCNKSFESVYETMKVYFEIKPFIIAQRRAVNLLRMSMVSFCFFFCYIVNSDYEKLRQEMVQESVIYRKIRTCLRKLFSAKLNVLK